MRIVIQRVSSASVTVSGDMVAGIGDGLCLLVGIAPDDTRDEVDAAVSKIAGLRIFPDHENKMNRSITEVGGQILVVSQFTLYGDMSRGRRPSFSGAAPPDAARAVIAQLIERFREEGIETHEGVFGALMSVKLVNEGPVTLILEITGGSVV